MLKKYVIIAIIISFDIFSQSQFQQFLSHVNSLTDPTQKNAAVDSFMNYARTIGIPFIEDSTANFLYIGNTSSVTAAGDFNGWNASSWSLSRVYQTNLWYRSVVFEKDARLDYKFVLNNSNWILDPENPNTCAGGFGPNSELSMPLYIQPWEINYQSSVQHGSLKYKTLFSSNVGSNYQITIYLPPGYDTLSQTKYPVAYFQDGSEYISLGRAVNVLDNLIDSSKIEPIIAVFVTPNNRNDEYAGNKRNQYQLFFVNELVPYIDNTYKTIPAPDKRLVMGDSFGGNISALISYNYPEVFGLCGLHSGAFWPNNYEAYNLIINGPIKNIKWSLIWGTYESLFSNMRSFRDFLIVNQYETDWLERPEGHSWGLWRASIDRILEYFFPNSSSDIIHSNELEINTFKLFQNYPNPFNPGTVISYQLPKSCFVTLKIFDVLGKEVAVLVNKEQPAGSFTIDFNSAGLSSGIYYYQLKSEGFTDTKPMLLLK